MRPVLFSWRGHAIPSYPAMLYVGIVFGIVVGDFVANATGLDGARVSMAILLLLPVALLGARLASVAGKWRVYRGAPRRIWRRSEGGQAMYGGLVAVPLSLPLLGTLHVPFWAFWDMATFTMLTGMLFARVGCLLTGCCAGRPTTSRFGIVLPDHRGVRTRRVPMQVIEGAVGFGVLVVAGLVASSRAPAGSVLLVSLATYSVARLALQPLRDHQGRVAGVPAIGAASTALLVVAVGSILARLG